MLAHPGPRLWCISLAAGIAMLVLPSAASAAAPECDTTPRQVSIPAGSSHENPRPPCTDADGDAITIKTVTAPMHGTLSPDDNVPIDDRQTYAADAGAAGETDVMTFRAVANGEESPTFNVEVQIGDPNRAPTCDAMSAAVQAGHAVDVPLTCADPDGNGITIDADAPAHGAFAAGRYTPAAGFSGQDTITFRATDEWGLTSDDAVATITVKPAPKPPVTTQPSPHHNSPPPAPPDKTAPGLTLLAPPSLALPRALRSGIAFMASTSEAGRLSVQLFVGRSTARRYRIDRHATSRVLVGTLTRDLAKGDNAVKLKLFRKARARLRKAESVRLRMIARIADAAGNVRTKRLRITLERT
jgi:transposase